MQLNVASEGAAGRSPKSLADGCSPIGSLLQQLTLSGDKGLLQELLDSVASGMSWKKVSSYNIRHCILCNLGNAMHSLD